MSGEGAQKESRPLRNAQGVDRIPPTPPTGGQTRVFRKSIKVARNNATGTYALGSNVGIVADTPDPRILATLSFGFREDGRDYPSIPAPFPGHSVAADQYVKIESGLWVAGNHIFDFTQNPVSPTFRAPWSYRWADTPGRLAAFLTFPSLPGTNVPPGDWWGTAEWALAPGAWIADDELVRLFGACQLVQLTPAVTVSTTGV